MSHHIDHTTGAPKPQHCCGDVSFNHETGEMKGVKPKQKDQCCCCDNKYKEQYEALIAEAEAEKNKFIQAALNLNIQECSEQDILDMIPGWIDEDGYMHIQDGWVDEDGYMHCSFRMTSDNFMVF